MAKNGFKQGEKEPRLSVRVSEELVRRVEKIAVANGISVADVVRMALNRGLPEAGKKKAA